MPDPVDPELAGELRQIVGQLVRRFREDRTVPVPQMWAMGWLLRQGPKTTSELAALERVRPQSMAQTVQQLEDAGLVSRSQDPSDGRKTLVALTAAGELTMEQLRVAGESWVSDAIGSRLTVNEQAELARGIELLGRLLDD